MTRKQICALAAVTAMLFLISLAVWKLGHPDISNVEGSGGAAGILTSSIVLYLAYLFSVLPGRSKSQK